MNRISVGTLVVDLYDSGTHQLVWRGTAQSELSNEADKNSQKLDKMFHKFPPKGAK